MTVTAIIQARMTSSRLPGKVLMPVLGEPLLLHQLRRLRRARTIDRIVLAITENAADDPLEDFAKRQGLPVFRGSEQDVLARFAGAAEACAPDADVIVRVTSDCPLMDPGIVDSQVGWFLTHRDAYDYATVGPELRLPCGTSVEVFTREALITAHAKAVTKHDREHVTPWIKNPENGLRNGITPIDIDAPEVRLSVDEEADFEAVSAIIEALYPARPDFSLDDVLAFLSAHPEIAAINSDVAQTTGPYAVKPVRAE